jgi:hypothetical protein
LHMRLSLDRRVTAVTVVTADYGRPSRPRSNPTAARAQWIPSRSTHKEVFEDVAALARMKRTAALATGKTPIAHSRLRLDAHDLVFGPAGGTGVGLWFVHGALLIWRLRRA